METIFPNVTMPGESTRDLIQECECVEFQRHIGVDLDSQDLSELGLHHCPYCKLPFKYKESKLQTHKNSLKTLVRELLLMLETVEESDSGNEFHPTTIQTCRCMDAVKLAEIMPKIKELCK